MSVDTGYLDGRIMGVSLASVQKEEKLGLLSFQESSQADLRHIEFFENFGKVDFLRNTEAFAEAEAMVPSAMSVAFPIWGFFFRREPALPSLGRQFSGTHGGNHRCPQMIC